MSFLTWDSRLREAKRLLAQADARIDESIRLNQQLMDEIAVWMKEAGVTKLWQRRFCK